MLKEKAEKLTFKYRHGSLRFKLTFAFSLFAIILMSCLWILQIVFMEEYYERSMEKRSQMAIALLSSEYANTELLDTESFLNHLGELSSDTDIYFYIESLDGSFNIASSERASYGRSISPNSTIVQETRAMLLASANGSVSYMTETAAKDRVLISARIVESQYRGSVYFYAFAPLTPMGPAVGILSSQLVLVTAVSLILGAIFAVYQSKRLSRPLSDIRAKAEQLSGGNLDVNFDVKGYSEVEDLGNTLTETAAELKRSDALQKDLLANVSHDLRTPLTMIKSYSELVRDISGDDKEKRDEHLGIIIEETDRLSDLVGDILTLSKMESGATEFESKPFDLKQAAETVLNTYRVLEESDGFSFSFDAPAEELRVCGDERRLKQVISNFLSNAVKYSSEDKRIELKLEDLGAECRFSVKDRGPGIAEEDLDGIWNRYQKASKTGRRAQTGSTGLGLSIAREILEKHGARYGVISEPGKGSEFWFEIKKQLDT